MNAALKEPLYTRQQIADAVANYETTDGESLSEQEKNALEEYVYLFACGRLGCPATTRKRMAMAGCAIKIGVEFLRKSRGVIRILAKRQAMLEASKVK